MDQILRAKFLESDATLSNTEKAYREIKKIFYQQRFVSEQKLLYEELAKSFGMSRTPVINALGRLEQEGYVVLKPNRGYFVASISRKEIEDYIDARQVIEEYCVKKVIERLKNDFREEYREYLKSLMDYYTNQPNHIDKVRLFIDRDYHVGICKLADNSITLDILSQLFERIYLRVPLITMPERLIAAKREHQELIDSIIELDIDTALAILQQHYQGTRHYASLALERQLTS